jgi:hypothetical protein
MVASLQFIEAKHNDMLAIWVLSQEKCIGQRPPQLTQPQHELFELTMHMNGKAWRMAFPK